MSPHKKLNRHSFLSYSKHFGSKFKNTLSYLYLVYTNISITTEKNNNARVLMAIGFDRVIRKDHLSQFTTYMNILTKHSIPYDKCHYRRKYTLFSKAQLANIYFIFKSRFNLRTFLNYQFKYATSRIDIKKYDKIAVFTDTAPLQNYICHLASKNNIKSYTFQHGFYPQVKEKYWRRIYRCMNAEYFFVWNQATINNSQGLVQKKRKVIKFAPIGFNKSFISRSYKLDSQSHTDIAVYFCGIDQEPKNIYLAKFCKALEKGDQYRVHKYAHPGFSPSDIKHYKSKHGIVFAEKGTACDLNIVLGSSIWIELASKEKDFILLDQYYEKRINLSTLEDFSLPHRGISESMMPFLSNDEMEHALVSTLSDSI